MTAATPGYGSLTDDDKLWLSRVTIGRKPVLEWLATAPPPDRVRSCLIKIMDRGDPGHVVSRLLAAHIGADPYVLYAENWPRKAARLAKKARELGNHPHAEKLHTALVALMFCASCGRPLEDPVSIDRGIGPDCWTRIDPQWKSSIAARITMPEAS
jgi:hypothetical protein